MPKCEMCGREDRLRRAKVEGTELNVCSNCTKYGEVIRANNYYSSKNSKNQPFIRKRLVKIEGPEYELVSDYNKIIQKVRQEKGMKQEDFAKLINEKLSVLQKWENGSLKIRIGVAKSLERKFDIKLLKLVGNDNGSEEDKDDDKSLSKFTSGKKGSDGLTLGDFIKVRKKK